MVPGNPGTDLGCVGLAQAQEFGSMIEILSSLAYAVAFVGLPILIIVAITVWTSRGDDDGRR